MLNLCFISFYLFIYLFCIFFWLFVFFLGLHLQDMEVPRLGVQSEMLLPAYATTTAMPDLRHICDLHHSSRQRQIPNPWARPGIKPKTSWFLVRFTSTDPRRELLFFFFFFFSVLKAYYFPCRKPQLTVSLPSLNLPVLSPLSRPESFFFFL